MSKTERIFWITFGLCVINVIITCFAGFSSSTYKPTFHNGFVFTGLQIIMIVASILLSLSVLEMERAGLELTFVPEMTPMLPICFFLTAASWGMSFYWLFG